MRDDVTPSGSALTRRGLLLAGVAVPLLASSGCGAGTPAVLRVLGELAEGLAYEVGAEALEWAAKHGVEAIRDGDASGESADDARPLVPVGRVYAGDGGAAWATRPSGVIDLNLDPADRVALRSADGRSSLIRPRAAEAIHRAWADWREGWPAADGLRARPPASPLAASRYFAPVRPIETVRSDDYPLRPGDVFENAFRYRTKKGFVVVGRVNRVETKEWPVHGRVIELEVADVVWQYQLAEGGLALA